MNFFFFFFLLFARIPQSHPGFVNHSGTGETKIWELINGKLLRSLDRRCDSLFVSVFFFLFFLVCFGSTPSTAAEPLFFPLLAKDPTRTLM